MEVHEQDIKYTDLDFDVQHPQERTAISRVSINKKHSRDSNTATPSHHRRMNSDGGNLVSKAALAALDTRVILGALLGWSLISKVLKRWNRTEGAMYTAEQIPSSTTPHASTLETEVRSLRKSLQNLRADNLALAAQVAQLHGGMLRVPRNNVHHQQHQRTTAPKALHDAFEAAASTSRPSSARNTTSVVINEQQENEASTLRTVAASEDTRDQLQEDQTTGDAAEFVLLQQENEQLRSALEQLRLENEEMAERMLEVAFRGSDAPTDEPLEVSMLTQLGDLRNTLISEAGGMVEIEEEEAGWVEIEGNYVQELNSFENSKNELDTTAYGNIGGPMTPELAHEGAEASGSRRHIPAAVYLED